MSPLELRSSLCVIVVDISPMSHLVLRPSSLPVDVSGAVSVPTRPHPFRFAWHLRNVPRLTVCIVRGTGGALRQDIPANAGPAVTPDQPRSTTWL